MKRKAIIPGGCVVGVAAFIALVRRSAADVIEIVNPGSLGLGKAVRHNGKRVAHQHVGGCVVDYRRRQGCLLHYLHNRGVSAIMIFDQANTFDSRRLAGTYRTRR